MGGRDGDGGWEVLLTGQVGAALAARVLRQHVSVVPRRRAAWHRSVRGRQWGAFRVFTNHIVLMFRPAGHGTTGPMATCMSFRRIYQRHLPLQR